MLSELELDLTNEIIEELEWEVMNNGDLYVNGLVPLYIGGKTIKEFSMENKKSGSKMFRPFFVASHSDILQQEIISEYPDTFIVVDFTKEQEKYYRLMVRDEEGQVIFKSRAYIHIKYANVEAFLVVKLGYDQKEATKSILEIYDFYNPESK